MKLGQAILLILALDDERVRLEKQNVALKTLLEAEHDKNRWPQIFKAERGLNRLTSAVENGL